MSLVLVRATFSTLSVGSDQRELGLEGERAVKRRNTMQLVSDCVDTRSRCKAIQVTFLDATRVRGPCEHTAVSRETQPVDLSCCNLHLSTDEGFSSLVPQVACLGIGDSVRDAAFTALCSDYSSLST